MPVKPTALGDLLFVMPDFGGGWMVVFFNSKTGEFDGAARHLLTKKAAQNRRRQLVRLHATLAIKIVKRKGGT